MHGLLGATQSMVDAMETAQAKRRGISLFGLSIEEMGQAAAKAEYAGFHSLWTSEIYARSATVPLAALALKTSRCVVGAGVMYAVGRSPVVLAAEARDLEELSDGRFILGLGSGTRRMISDWHGEDSSAPARRMEELIPLLRELWRLDGRPIHHDGKFYRTHLVPFDDAGDGPLCRPTIYTAGVNPRMIEAAGRVADGFLGHVLMTRRYLEDVTLPALERGRGRSTRSTDDLPVARFVLTSIDENEEQARLDAARMIAFYGSVKTYGAAFEIGGFGGNAARIREAFARHDMRAMFKAVSDEMIDEYSAAGTAEQVNAKLRHCEGLVNELILFAPSVGVDMARVRANIGRMIEHCAPARAGVSAGTRLS